MLTIMMMTICFLMSNLYPLKITLTLALSSIFASIICYISTNSVIVPSMLTISFSSGMMILFSYCAMSTTFQTKNKKNPISYIIMTLLFLNFMVNTNQENISTKSFSLILSINFQSLMIMMMMVIITMFFINMTFFNPTKKFMQSY